MTTSVVGMQLDREPVETVFASVAVAEICIINRFLTKNKSNLVRTAQKDLANVIVIC